MRTRRVCALFYFTTPFKKEKAKNKQVPNNLWVIINSKSQLQPNHKQSSYIAIHLRVRDYIYAGLACDILCWGIWCIRLILPFKVILDGPGEVNDRQPWTKQMKTRYGLFLIWAQQSEAQWLMIIEAVTTPSNIDKSPGGYYTLLWVDSTRPKNDALKKKSYDKTKRHKQIRGTFPPTVCGHTPLLSGSSAKN